MFLIVFTAQKFVKGLCLSKLATVSRNPAVNMQWITIESIRRGWNIFSRQTGTFTHFLSYLAYRAVVISKWIANISTAKSTKEISEKFPVHCAIPTHIEHDGFSNHWHPDFYSTGCSGAAQRKHHNSASLNSMRGIHWSSLVQAWAITDLPPGTEEHISMNHHLNLIFSSERRYWQCRPQLLAINCRPRYVRGCSYFISRGDMAF